MKIVILDSHALNPGDLSYDCLRQFGELTIYDRTDSEAEAIKRIGDSEIVLVNKVQITESLLEACPNIRLICVQATGYNVVDCAACAKRGIPVTNVPTYGTAAVAQFTMALMLELCHRVGLHNHDVHTGGWVNASCFTYWLTPQMELAGKTLGIIGFGAIGKAVGRLAKAFGMRVIAYNRSQSEEGRQIAEYVDLDFHIDEGETLIAIKKREEAERQAKLTANRGAVVVGGDDTRLLAALIYCEAGNETYNGQLAVGAVVMNRVRSGAYPNTISGVIFASGQFTPALNGKVARVYTNGNIPDSCYQAATASINGETNVGGATHFRRAGNHDGIQVDNQVFW